jgi:hypothetical protein
MDSGLNPRMLFRLATMTATHGSGLLCWLRLVPKMLLDSLTLQHSLQPPQLIERQLNQMMFVLRLAY